MSIEQQVKDSIEQAMDATSVDVAQVSGGHFEIRVVSTAFEGKSLLQKQRLVLSAIAHLMKGEQAPVHAVDKLETIIP